MMELPLNCGRSFTSYEQAAARAPHPCKHGMLQGSFGLADTGVALGWPARNWRLRHEKPNSRLDPVWRLARITGIQ